MKPDWTDMETNAARSLRDSGLTYAVIAQRVGRTAQGVKRRLQYIREDRIMTKSPTEGAVPVGALLICDQTGGRIFTCWPVPHFKKEHADTIYGDAGGYRTVPLYAAPTALTKATTWLTATAEQRERITLLADVELHLQSVRVFITSREKMYPCGVELHDELLAKVSAAIDVIGRERGNA